MGDRSQVCIKDNDARVYLYSHWGGKDIYTAAVRGLKRAPDRWDNPEYLARNIFCEMVKGQENETTGFGIGVTEHGDIEHPVPVFDVNTQIVTWEGEGFAPPPPCTFAKFVARHGT